MKQSRSSPPSELSVPAETAALLDWYRIHARDLPWRTNPSPYKTWVSEIMLQQTRADVVARRFEDFLNRFPDALSLANASEEEVVGAWSGLGYYRRARLMHQGACFVAERYGGELPSDLDALRGIPGIGSYTGAAIASIAFGLGEPAIDSNLERVLGRLFAVPGRPKSSAFRKRIETEARRLMVGAPASEFNQALMDLGSSLCSVRSPQCGRCPLEPWCLAKQGGTPEDFPERMPRKATQKLALACVIVRCSKGVLFFERGPDEALLAGTWGLPTVPVPMNGEGGGEDVRRETVGKLREQILAAISTPIELGASIGTVAHSILHWRIRLDVYEARWPAALDSVPTSLLRGRFLTPRAQSKVGVSSMYQKALALEAKRGAACRDPSVL